MQKIKQWLSIIENYVRLALLHDFHVQFQQLYAQI